MSRETVLSISSGLHVGQYSLVDCLQAFADRKLLILVVGCLAPLRVVVSTPSFNGIGVAS